MKRIAIACLMFTSVAYAQSDVARSVGRVAGQFGVGVADSIRDTQHSGRQFLPSQKMSA